MNDEPNSVRSFVEEWACRALTISGCLLIWVLLLALFPLLLIAGSIIDLWRGRAWVVTRCVLFFPFYFSCEVFGIIASLVIWLMSGWGGARTARWPSLKADDRLVCASHFALSTAACAVVVWVADSRIQRCNFSMSFAIVREPA